uniref:Transmembrane serine protease 5 n=1 Tax=Xenopus tropicalis TaxID=8364 RepID=F6TC15_XENTR
MRKGSRRVSLFDIFPETINEQDVTLSEAACEQGVGVPGDTVISLPEAQPADGAAGIISTVTDARKQNVPSVQTVCETETRAALCSLRNLSRILFFISILLSVGAVSLSICLIYYKNPVLLLTSRSVLQLYGARAGRYYTVCHQGWKPSHGWTVCRELGFNSHTMSSPVLLSAMSPIVLEAFAIVNKTDGTPNNLETFMSPVDICPTQEGVSLQCTDCGQASVDIPRIVGGTDSSLGKWPWQVSLRWDGRHMCGGSIISSQWVMSAAHCFVLNGFLTVSRWKIHAGSISLSTGIAYSVRNIYYNGLYSLETNDYDVALLKTTVPMSFSDTTRPVCLPRAYQQFQVTANCWIIGWGHVSEGGQLSPVLQEAKVQLISSQICNHSSNYAGQISPRMLCAGYPDGRADSCQGDSGGPLVCQEGGLWWQVGIVSWGEGCGRPNRPGVYTNLTEVLDWVYHRLQMDSEAT